MDHPTAERLSKEAANKLRIGLGREMAEAGFFISIRGKPWVKDLFSSLPRVQVIANGFEAAYRLEMNYGNQIRQLLGSDIICQIVSVQSLNDYD